MSATEHNWILGMFHKVGRTIFLTATLAIMTDVALAKEELNTEPPSHILGIKTNTLPDGHAAPAMFATFSTRSDCEMAAKAFRRMTRASVYEVEPNGLEMIPMPVPVAMIEYECTSFGSEKTE